MLVRPIGRDLSDESPLRHAPQPNHGRSVRRDQGRPADAEEGLPNGGRVSQRRQVSLT